jgi:hypothetical protein
MFYLSHTEKEMYIQTFENTDGIKAVFSLDEATSLTLEKAKYIHESYLLSNEYWEIKDFSSTGKTLYIPVSVGEVIDKITILNIKLAKATADIAWSVVDKIFSEITQLKEIIRKAFPNENFYEFDATKGLERVNGLLWDIEDELRVMEKKGEFNAEFIKLARSVYTLNDLRFAYKKELNELFNSEICEVKFFTVEKTEE